MANIEFVTPEHGKLIAQAGSGKRIAIDVSSYGEEPFCYLSPFTYDQDIQIPVPGMDAISHSVEGIWQGLKVIDGKIDPTLFDRKPRKRKGQVEGHLLGTELLGLEEARARIYIPSYSFYLSAFAPKEPIDFILENQRGGKIVALYDVESNGDIRTPAPLAHASVLATYLNLKIFNLPLVPRDTKEGKLYAILDSDDSIDGKIARIESLGKDSAIWSALKHRCVEHPMNADDYRVGRYFGGRDD